MAGDDCYQERIKQIIADCSGVARNLIFDHSWLDTDLYIDSLILTEIVYALEASFYLSITERDLIGMNQVSDVYRLIAKKLMERNDISI